MLPSSPLRIGSRLLRVAAAERAKKVEGSLGTVPSVSTFSIWVLTAPLIRSTSVSVLITKRNGKFFAACGMPYKYEGGLGGYSTSISMKGDWGGLVPV